MTSQTPGGGGGGANKREQAGRGGGEAARRGAGAVGEGQRGQQHGLFFSAGLVAVRLVPLLPPDSSPPLASSRSTTSLARQRKVSDTCSSTIVEECC